MENNIHILPTDKPSRLQLNVNTKMLVLFNNIQSNNESAHLTTQNIYITSDEELPYDSTIFHTGAFYHIDFGGDVHIINKDTHYPNPNFCSRIILTTDESLFKYGVQAIDDEFLEWFVKNPSCDEVKTYYIPNEFRYEIIIPKEEPKQRLEKYSERFDNDKSAIGNPKTWGKRMVDEQETLEEAFDRIFDSIDYILFDFTSFEQGAKWQMERSYSLDDLKEAFSMGRVGKTIKYFNEQFKNK